MVTFKEFYELLTEVKDSTRNQQELIRVYGLNMSNGMVASPEDALMRAKDLINQWNEVEANIDPKNDYFGSPNNKTYNPRDIFSWGRIAKDMKWEHPEGLENLKAMITNLYRHKEKKVEVKKSDKDYDVLIDNEHARLYRPKSEKASCRLGARTKWCTASTQGLNQFNSYTEQGIVLFYVITKRKQFNTAQAVWPPEPASGQQDMHARPTGVDFKPEEKYAIALYPDGQTMQVYDEEDNQIEWGEWEDIAAQIEIPTDRAFYMKFGPLQIDVLKHRSNTAKAIISGQQQRGPEDQETDGDLFADVLRSVETIFRDKDPEQISALAKYRKQESMPDAVFLMDVYDSSSLRYFTSREYNPPGSNNWSNGDFQDEIVRHIGRLATMTKQVNSDDWKDGDVEEMDDLTYKVYGPNDGDEARDVFWQIRMYVSRHMKDEWPALEKALINLWMTNHGATNIKTAGGYSEHTDHPMDKSLMWLRMVMDYRNGEWPELEEALHKRIKHVLHSSPGDDNLINGLVSMGSTYNRSANFGRTTEVVDQRAFVPENEEQLKRYADGEWDIDGPPLTQRAKQERKWKKGYNKSENI